MGAVQKERGAGENVGAGEMRPTVSASMRSEREWLREGEKLMGGSHLAEREKGGGRLGWAEPKRGEGERKWAAS